MLSFLVWMVTEFDNTSSEVQQDPPQENWGKLSFVLRILFPVAGLLFLLNRKHVFSKILLQIDRNCVSVFCPSFSRREKLLKWAGSRLPQTWSSQSRTLAGGVAALWSDGSLLCTLINSAIPGACPNPHRHWKKPPLHAQAIAYKYLGIIPIFTESDLKGNLTISQERNFLLYLNELQQSITKLSERNDTSRSISVHYIVRGMGLYTGEQHRKTVFYVYRNSNTGQDGSIIVHIRGPYATYGQAVIPKFHNDLFTTPEINVTSDLLSTKKLLSNTMKKNSFIKNLSLPFMQYHKKHMGDNIVIDVAMENDRAKVTYIPKNYGMYEIIMVSNGEIIRGCPFNVNIVNNISGIEDNFETEESMDNIPSFQRRKVLSKTIDFVDEQISLDEVLKKYQTKDYSLNENRIQAEEVTYSVELKEANKHDEEIELVVSQKESFNLGNKSNLIEEEDEEDCSLINSNTNSDTEADINFKLSVAAQKDEMNTKNPTHGNYSIINHNLIENIQTHDVIQKVNNYTDNSNTYKVVNDSISENFELKSTTESANDDEVIITDLDKRRQIFDVDFNKNSNTLSSDSIQRKVKVKKIKIPEKFCEVSNISNANLYTKSLKYVINTSNKIDSLHSVYEDTIKYTKMKPYLEGAGLFIDDSINNDDNNNSNSITNLNYNDMKCTNGNLQIKSEKNIIVPERFIRNSNQEQTQHLELQANTSPICLDHIVPEVEHDYIRMSVAERRKIFASKISNNIATSASSSVSESENAENPPNRGHFKHYDGLTVLNYLSSLKKSEYNNNPEPYSLCNTMSLPNISSIDGGIFQNSVKERKNFWEKMSSSSSSLSINSDAYLKKKNKRMTDMERCQLIWKKPEGTEAPNTSISTDLDKKLEISKSVDDILSMRNTIGSDADKKYKSLDHSLDRCTILSIDERKRILLKQNYEKEIPRRKSSLRNNSVKEYRKKLLQRRPTIQNEDENVNVIVFSPILDRIKKYDSACNLLSNKIEEEAPKTSQSDSKDLTPDSRNISNLENSTNTKNLEITIAKAQDSEREILTSKSHFKRAINYFKNLEEKSLNKSEGDLTLVDYRRHSLDIPSNKRRSYRKGGSLSLPQHLYEDVFGDKNGGFKGAANRSALVEALATFSRKENRSVRCEEDNITYEMFKKRAKTRRRRSIKSIFDVYY